MVVPTASILENGWNRPISAIKGVSLTPSQHTPPSHPTPFEDVVLQRLGEVLLRLVLRVEKG